MGKVQFSFLNYEIGYWGSLNFRNLFLLDWILEQLRLTWLVRPTSRDVTSAVGGAHPFSLSILTSPFSNRRGQARPPLDRPMRISSWGRHRRPGCAAIHFSSLTRFQYSFVRRDWWGPQVGVSRQQWGPPLFSLDPLSNRPGRPMPISSWGCPRRPVCATSYTCARPRWTAATAPCAQSRWMRLGQAISVVRCAPCAQPRWMRLGRAIGVVRCTPCASQGKVGPLYRLLCSHDQGRSGRHSRLLRACGQVESSSSSCAAMCRVRDKARSGPPLPPTSACL